MRNMWTVGGVIILALAVAVGGAEPPGEAPQTRNPFGVPDAPDPDVKDVRDYAAKVKLPGDAKDPNAEQWVKKETEGKKGSPEGEWQDRWNVRPGAEWQYGKGPTQIKAVGDRVYLLIDSSTGKYLMDTKRDKDRLVGWYRGFDAASANTTDCGPCVLLIVDDERIDGQWGGIGRWDFRRKLK